MNHPAKRLVYPTIILAALMFAACSKEQPIAQKKTQELTPEQKAARDLQKSNEAVTEIGKKIGRKAQPIDLNLPQEKKTEATATPATKP